MQNERAIRRPRGQYDGVLQIVRFNWPLYAMALGVCGVSLAALEAIPALSPLRWLAWAMIAATAYWLVASLLASHWIYDRSRIYQWAWIKETLPNAPRRWANLHAGLDESSDAIKQVFPQSTGVVLDVFDAGEMTEPSISKARMTTNSSPSSKKADFRNLPFARGELEAVFLIFAAHEIRKAASRLVFFQELRRVLRPDGVVLLAEHLRDLPNFLAFGPGFVHFQHRSAWLNAAAKAAFVVEHEFGITPFVRMFLLRKAGASRGCYPGPVRPPS